MSPILLTLFLTAAAVLVVVGVVARNPNRHNSGRRDIRTVPLPAEVVTRVRELVARDHVVSAVREIRPHTRDLSLKQCKQLVEAIGAGHVPPVTDTEQASGEGELADRVRRARSARGEVEAIRLVRQETGMGLHEAEKFVRALD